MEKTCPFCKRYLKGGSNHIYYCNKKPINLTKNDIKYKFIKYHFPEISKKDVILYEYSLMSLPDLKRKYNIDYKSIQFLLKYFNIHIRGITESTFISRPKAKKTLLNKFGVDNVSKLEIIKEKKRQTFLKHYGVDNIRKDENFRKYMSVYIKDFQAHLSDDNKKIISKKISDANKKYQLSLTDNEKILHRKKRIEWWNNLPDENKIKHLKKSLKPSKLEIKVINALINNNYSIESQVYINRKSYDIKLNPFKIIIEVNGDYWHANPLIYKENDILNSNKTAKDIWKKDLDKKINAEKYGYTVIYLWESELKNKEPNEIINILFNKINEVFNVSENQIN
ncbi:MAG: hypothetical protein WC783_03390 [Candidatus Paceibacterota bacterium]|jgi:G:T-mismatch repair DNA endonuclease (very short patch repair protein)